jgi:hypothetical protein
MYIGYGSLYNHFSTSLMALHFSPSPTSFSFHFSGSAPMHPHLPFSAQAHGSPDFPGAPAGKMQSSITSVDVLSQLCAMHDWFKRGSLTACLNVVPENCELPVHLQIYWDNNNVKRVGIGYTIILNPWHPPCLFLLSALPF